VSDATGRAGGVFPYTSVRKSSAGRCGRRAQAANTSSLRRKSINSSWPTNAPNQGRAINGRFSASAKRDG
jgi:hypothetical protein